MTLATRGLAREAGSAYLRGSIVAHLLIMEQELFGESSASAEEEDEEEDSSEDSSGEEEENEEVLT